MTSHPRLAIRGPVFRSDLTGIQVRASRHVATVESRLIVLELSAVPADAVALDALARVGLEAGRRGCRVALLGAGPELWALIELSGLTDSIVCEGQAE